MKYAYSILALICTSSSFSLCIASTPAKTTERRELLTEAIIRGTNAQHGLLTRRAKTGDESCFGTTNLSDEALTQFVSQQKKLLETDPTLIQSWLQGTLDETNPNSFNPAAHLLPLAQQGPVSGKNNPTQALLTALKNHVPATTPLSDLKAVSSLHQMVLEVDRDGDALQNLFALYHSNAFPVSIEALGAKGDGRTLRTMAVTAAKNSCRTPYDSTPTAWRLALQKIWNWGAKTNGTRNTAKVAAEIEKSAELKSLLPSLKSAAPRAITIVGHSFTMDRHWSTAAAFVPLVSAVLKSAQSAITITQITAGGLDALWAKNEFLPKALATQAQDIYFVVTATQPKEWQALAEMVTAVKKSGRRAFVFDAIDFYDPYDHREHIARSAVAAAQKAGAEVIEVQKPFDRANAGMRNRYLSLDGVHMTEPYHRFMAGEWLRFLGKTRTAQDKGPSFQEDKLLYETDVAKKQLAAATANSPWATVYKDALAQDYNARATDIAELYTRASYLPQGITSADAVDDLLEAYRYTSLNTDSGTSLSSSGSGSGSGSGTTQQ